jgi:hypothetical protein
MTAFEIWVWKNEWLIPEVVIFGVLRSGQSFYA